MREKNIQRLIDIPDYVLNDINIYCTKYNISINHFMNIAVINNLSDELTSIKITKKTHMVPTRVRIRESAYQKIKYCTSKCNISMQKLILHCILEELEKFKNSTLINI